MPAQRLRAAIEGKVMPQFIALLMVLWMAACAPLDPGADFLTGQPTQVGGTSASDTNSNPNTDAAPPVGVSTPTTAPTDPNTTPTAPAGPTCPPGKGNATGVGTPCTLGGNECAAFGFNAFVCGADIAGPTTKNLPLLQQCLGICDATAPCGADAACVANPLDANGPWICLPNSCVAKAPTAAPPSVNTCLLPKPNDKGLGNLCTKKGNECSAGGLLALCSATVLASSPLTFCTTVCSVDSECGTDMRCMHNLPNNGSGLPAGTAVCIPRPCLPTLP